MIISEQDQNIILQDSVRQKPDTTLQKITVPADSAVVIDSVNPAVTFTLPEIKTTDPVDTTVVCRRNPIYDLIFHDPENGVATITRDCQNRFPFLFTEINSRRESEAMRTLIKHLKDGKEIPSRPFQNDWIILVVIVSAVIYATLSAFYGKLFHEVKRFFLFRGISDLSTRDTGALFHWKSTLINLISFFNIALFSYCTANYYDLIPDAISGLIFWLISFIVIVAAITLRHIICYLTGKISTAGEVFDEYLVTIYQSYRFLALILFMLIILLSYTSLFPSELLFISGFIIVALFYLLRIFRLLLIFLKRNMSILYLILYLCALEFLPVLILLKYFTDLF